MSDVILGVDPHKKSVTIEAIDEQGRKLATGRSGTATGDYKAMLGYVRGQWPRHRWAVEDAHGVGRPLAQRLLADGERVVDVPAKLAARVRVSTRVTRGRPTPLMLMRSRRQCCGHRTFGCSHLTRSWSPCGCWLTGATSCRRGGCRR